MEAATEKENGQKDEADDVAVNKKFDDPGKRLSELGETLKELEGKDQVNSDGTTRGNGGNITSADIGEEWRKQEQTVQIIRTFVNFHATLLMAEPPPFLLPFLLQQCNSLRSAVARNALIALEEVFRLCPEFLKMALGTLQILLFEDIIRTLLLKASNEKKFIADAARKALDSFAKADVFELRRFLMINLTDTAKTTKNMKLASIATETCATVFKCSDIELLRNSTTMEKFFTAVVDIESGKSTEARSIAQSIIRSVKQRLGEKDFSKLVDAIGLSAAARVRLDKILDQTSQNKDKRTAEKPWAISANKEKIESAPKDNGHDVI